MDAPTPQPWGLGLKPKLSSNLPPSFIVFFPARDNGASSHGKNNTGPRYTNLSWVGLLRAPVRVHREPAWHRVPTEYFVSKNNTTRTIMTRIGHPQKHLNEPLFFLSSHAEIAAANHIESWTEPTAMLMPPKKHRRRIRFAKSNQTHPGFCGEPLSIAEMAHMFMAAKVDIVNGILSIPRRQIRADYKFLESKENRKIYSVPAKRWIDKKDCIDTHGKWGGFKLLSYIDLHHLCRTASKNGDSKISLQTAAIAELAQIFKGMKPSPRVPLALAGMTELEDIADKTAYLSALDLAKFEESGKSPTKKSPHSVLSLKDTPRRLSDTVVKLLPASSPQVEPSPVKSFGTPSTPFVDSPSSVKATAQSPSPMAAATTRAMPSSPLVDIPSLAPGPTKHFSAPSYDSSASTSLDETCEQTPPEHISPTKAVHPVAETSLVETGPATPHHAPLHQQRRTSDLGLVSAMPASTPKPDASRLQPNLAVDPQINFGPVSPSFKAPSWLNSTITSRAKQTAKQTSRRNSEPLMRNCIRNQVARRKTFSPRKVVFQSDEACNAATSHTSTPTQKHQAAVDVDMNGTPEQRACSDPTLSMVTPAICWGRMTGRVSSDGALNTPARTRDIHMNGVHNIDMRQNPDIFGAPAMSTVPSPNAINRLADMAVERCDGQAKVQVSEENGRLIVRFKLPTGFAYLFPDTQGMDESHFTTSPSAVSSSPRITFKGHELTLSKVDKSPAPEEPELPSLKSNSDNTSIASGFDASPQVPALTPTPAAKLNTSFTPVNGSSSSSSSDEDKSNENGRPTQQDKQSVHSKHYEDSPGRDYMRDFIKRTHRKRLSATETGSPIAPPAKRAPLGIKSPNVESPQKGKRKAGNEEHDRESPLKTSAGPQLKKARRAEVPSPGKTSSAASKGKEPVDRIKVSNVATKAESTTTADDEKAASATGARRSTRLRSQMPGSTAKSSIPTSIKLGGRANGGRSAFTSATRNEEKDLSNKTRRNTLKNRGNAEYPAQVLARHQEERLRETTGEGSSNPEAPAKVTAGRKSVGWKTPLEAHQGEDAKKSRIATIKPKTTGKVKSSGIAKPTRNTTTTAQKQQRTAKVAATLGMSQNGTPAKPNRVTRSSARVRA